ncbi:MAG: SurA N-terminal domain-containing protein [Clostridiales bacterium]|jgi:parvulin-like peptidyl-prolyl isomerase|nr:SurA N-terminal domain-containing protein [Clostridiales bacterium]
MKKRFTALIALLLLAAALLAGCSLVSVNQEKDLAQIVAKVGEEEITKEYFLNELKYMVNMYQQFGMDPTQSTDEFAYFKKMIVDEMLNYEMQNYEARKRGYADKLTDDDLKEIEESVDDIDREVYNAAVTQTNSSLETNPDLNYDEELTVQYRVAAASYVGEEMDQSGLREWGRDYYIKNKITAMLQDDIYAEVTISDEEVRAAYDEKVESDTLAAEDLSYYKSAQEDYEKYGGIPPMFVPDGYKRFKLIKVDIPADFGEEYNEKLTKMEEIKAEIGDLAVAEETSENTALLAERKAEYSALQVESAAIRDAALAQSKTKIDEASQKLSDGAAFDDVMKEYTSDLDYIDYPAFGESGKLMSVASEVEDWDAAIKTAALALTTPGDYTDTIELADGYYILQYVKNEPGGVRSFADYEADFRETALTEKQDAEWSALLAEWVADTSVVTVYQDIIDGITAADLYA